MTATTTVTEKKSRNGVKWTLTMTVERTPATLSEIRMARPTWFDYVADHVTACYKVKVTTVDSMGGAPYVENYFEIVTPFGTGVVVHFQHGYSLEGFIPRSGVALSTGCWKKRGTYVGHTATWFAIHGVNVNNKKKVDHTCYARLWRTAGGLPW